MKLLRVLIFSILTHVCVGQDFEAEFIKFCEEGDTTKQLDILKKWEKQKPQDAELFTSYFNYFFNKSRQEFVSLTKAQPAGESLSLQDSIGNTAGYIGSQIFFDEKTLKKGLDKIEKGIKLYPNRLDMRFGKIYALGQIMDWQSFTNEIVSTVQYSATNNNEWTWTDNEKVAEGKDFFLTSIQDYQLDLYDTGDDALLINMRTIANEILNYYPDHIESLSNLSITYLLTGKYDEAIETLMKAEKIDPTDAIVLSNIAHGYKLKGENEKAIHYYKKTIEYGDERISAFAKQQIVELKKSE